MRIAFYAPLKSPNHPVVSGDRQMARLLIRALELTGHTVEIASELRTYFPTPDFDRLNELRSHAEGEANRLEAEWRSSGKPDLWITYHPYYKSPDLIGPPLASAYSLPYVTIEASYSKRRNVEAWAQTQASVQGAVRQAALNLCLTRRDHDTLARDIPGAVLAMLPAFIDPAPFGRAANEGNGARLVTVAMMRPGDKLESYRRLAAALHQLPDLPWSLSIIGDGQCRDEVRDLFEGFGGERIVWHGQIGTAEIADILAVSGIFVWPGCGEAFGLAYLEAQAAGLPVVAQDTAGVPEVVRHGETGLLTPDGDVAAYAAAIALLLRDKPERQRLGANARCFVLHERSLDAAARRLDAMLLQAMPA